MIVALALACAALTFVIVLPAPACLLALVPVVASAWFLIQSERGR